MYRETAAKHMPALNPAQSMNPIHHQPSDSSSGSIRMRPAIVHAKTHEA
jgi:hypothetical protein